MQMCASVRSKGEEESENFNETLHFYVDSGCSNHMINKNFLYNARNLENKKVMVANSNELSVSSAGDVDLNILQKGQRKKMTIKNVEYVPDLCANLLSVRQITKSGKKVLFEKDVCKIFGADAKIIACAETQ